LPRLGVCSRQPSTEIAAPRKQNFPHHWKFSKAHNGSRFLYGFQTFIYIYIYDHITKLCRQTAEVIKNHENTNVRIIGQGEPRHWKLKLGGGQSYDRSSE
jgi:hypothetical protein